MKRAEFPRFVKRTAFERSGGFCEAMGKVYGLAPGVRCNAPLMHRVEYDHYPIAAAAGGPGTLENCVAVCRTCHRWKTGHFDRPILAKHKRVRDRHLGIKDDWVSFPTNRKGPWKRGLNGVTTRRFEQ